MIIYGRRQQWISHERERRDSRSRSLRAKPDTCARFSALAERSGSRRVEKRREESTQHEKYRFLITSDFPSLLEFLRQIASYLFLSATVVSAAFLYEQRDVDSRGKLLYSRRQGWIRMKYAVRIRGQQNMSTAHSFHKNRSIVTRCYLYNSLY